MKATVITDMMRDIVYPESDGLPMAENTKQFRYIVTVKENLDALYASVDDVFVAGDLFWYPVKGEPGIRIAPDVLVVFGRPKGDRGSYRQWLEDNIPPQVVFEIWSPSNRALDLVRKLEFYEEYGVEEYYWFDPETGELAGYRRVGAHLEAIAEMVGWVSPRLNIRFTLEEGEMVLIQPNGQRFQTFQEVAAKVQETQQQVDLLSRRVTQEAQRATQETQRAEQEAQRAAAAEAEAARLRELLRQAGMEPK